MLIVPPGIAVIVFGCGLLNEAHIVAADGHQFANLVAVEGLQQPDAVAAGGLADDLHQDVELVEGAVVVPGAVGVKALCCCFHGDELLVVELADLAAVAVALVAEAAAGVQVAGGAAELAASACGLLFLGPYHVGGELFGQGSVRLLDDGHVGALEEWSLEEEFRPVGITQGELFAVGEEVEVAGTDGQVCSPAVEGHPAEALGGFDVEDSVHGYNTVLGSSFLIL